MEKKWKVKKGLTLAWDKRLLQDKPVELLKKRLVKEISDARKDLSVDISIIKNDVAHLIKVYESSRI